MTALLDTSMLVRYLTGDPPELADLSAQVSGDFRHGLSSVTPFLACARMPGVGDGLLPSHPPKRRFQHGVLG